MRSICVYTEPDCVHGPRSLSIVLLIIVLLTPKLSSLHAELTRPCNECSIQTHTITHLISIIPILKAIGTIFLLLLLLSGDVELNPGPNDLTENSSEISSDSFEKFLEKSITLVHLNVQSLTNKLDIIQAEFGGFDIITLNETWLDFTSTSDD